MIDMLLNFIVLSAAIFVGSVAVDYWRKKRL